MTNLHLGNARGDLTEVAACYGIGAIEAIEAAAHAAARCFEESLYLGADVMLDARGDRATVIEVNAFGDLLPRILFHEKTTYAAQVDAMLERPEPS